jgi:hypothetical protein
MAVLVTCDIARGACWYSRLGAARAGQALQGKTKPVDQLAAVTSEDPNIILSSHLNIRSSARLSISMAPIHHHPPGSRCRPAGWHGSCLIYSAPMSCSSSAWKKEHGIRCKNHKSMSVLLLRTANLPMHHHQSIPNTTPSFKLTPWQIPGHGPPFGDTLQSDPADPPTPLFHAGEHFALLRRHSELQTCRGEGRVPR